MLIREIIVPNDTTITMHVPQSMVGQKVEVIVFNLDEPALTQAPSNKQEQVGRIEQITSAMLKDLSGLKFDRNKANDYDA